MTALGETDAEKFLGEVFKDATCVTVSADDAEKQSFQSFMERYRKMLPVEKMSAQILNA